ncbi:MAG: GNAT family N-acetyltransferase [Eubacterium sp.]|nr:GNAT family N-acetyltransferase [Eubacterium sp.]
MKNKAKKTIPMIITERLVMKGITENDTDSIVNLRGEEEVYKYFKNPHKLTKEEHENWFNSFYVFDNCRYDWIAFEKESEKVVGVFGVFKSGDSSFGAEVSYLLDKEFRGAGYGHEALNGVINWAKDNLNISYATAVIHKNNTKSIDFAKREGFVKTSKDGLFYIFKKEL